MTTPALTSSIPADGATNVATNQTLELHFNTPLLALSVNQGTITLINEDTGEAIDCRFALSSNVITLLPGRALEDYTSFAINIIGEDQGSLTGSLTSSDGDPLLVTITVAFQTARPITVGTTSTTSTYTVTTIDESGDSLSVEYDTFAVENVIPTDGTLYLSPTYIYANGITFDLTQDILALSASGNIEVEQRPFVDRRFLVAEPTDIALLSYVSPSGQVYCPDSLDRLRYPYFEYTVDGDKLTVTFPEASGDIRWNAQIRVTVKANLESTEDSGSQELGTAYNALFTTGAYPWYGEIETIRDGLGPLNEVFNDFLIGKYILKNSVRAWTLACFKFELCNVPYFVVDYVNKKTVLDLVMSPTGQLAIGQDRSKSLGDFSVSQGSPGATWKDMLASMKQEVDELEGWLRNMCGTGIGGMRIATAVKGSESALTPPGYWRTRHWHLSSYGDEYKTGVENSRLDRVNKLPMIDEYWS